MNTELLSFEMPVPTDILKELIDMGLIKGMTRVQKKKTKSEANAAREHRIKVLNAEKEMAKRRFLKAREDIQAIDQAIARLVNMRNKAVNVNNENVKLYDKFDAEICSLMQIH